MKVLKFLGLMAAAAGLCSCNLLEVKYTVGGTVTGLTGTGLVLEVNSTDSLDIDANGNFLFSSGVAKGDTYTVTVAQQPTNTLLAIPTETCTVYNGSGTIESADIGNVVVTCVHEGEFAYVANQTANSIAAYSMDPDTGALTAITGSPFAAGGTTPIELVVDPNGAYLYCVNFDSNDVSVFTLTNGVPTESISTIATGTAPSAMAIHPSNLYAYVVNSADDTVIAYTLANGTATPISGGTYTVGVDPMDVKIDPAGNFLYVANYSDGTVSAFAIDYTTGALTEIGGSPFAAGGSGSGSRSIAIDATDTLLYVANEKSATISAYTLTALSGTLVPVTGTFSTGSSPEQITTNPGGNFLYAANATSDNEIAEYSIVPSTGVITVGTTVASGTLPASVAIDPLGKYLYAANFESGTVYAYGINAGTGALTQIGTPIVSGAGAISIAID